MREQSEKILEILHFGTIMVGEGEKAREVQEQNTDFDTLVNKFNSYFLVKRNIIHERFVVGLIDRRLKEKLQLIPELSLSKALEIARQHEQTNIQMKQSENISQMK